MAPVIDIQREQQEIMPRDDLRPYEGQWVALRDGHVVASDIDAVALRNNEAVRETDVLIPVPLDGNAILILVAAAGRVMPSATLVYTDPFQAGIGKPYLVLHLTGINGASGHVTGLVDSGADITQLPVGYASLMGYDATTLQPMTVGTAGSPAQVVRATKPCKAYVPGLQGLTVDFLPVSAAAPTFYGAVQTSWPTSA